MVNIVLVMIFFSVSFVNLTHDVHAENGPEKVTPYGEKCPLCGEYGYCSKQPTHGEAITALQSYYGNKGLTVIILNPRNRFLEVGVYRKGTLVDRVLLDLKTGRIRSTY